MLDEIVEKVQSLNGGGGAAGGLSVWTLWMVAYLILMCVVWIVFV